MTYLLNTWYQAAWSTDLLADQPLARKIADQPLVFFRDSAGAAHALDDRCPHRFAPLSAGKVQGDQLRCGYHGLGFDGSGQCVHSPHGPIPKAACVRSYPLVERHRALWVWLGDPALADAALIRDLSFIDETPEVAAVCGYMPTKASYLLLTDNIMDLSHLNYLHPQTLGEPSPAVKLTVREEGAQVIARWADEATPASLFHKAMNPSLDRVDTWVDVAWSAPALMVLDTGLNPAGVPARWEDHSLTLHSMTPETATSTHYFFYFTRRMQLDNAELTQSTRQLVERAFRDEDKPMLEAQQAAIGEADIWQLKPTLMAIDAGALRARRRLAELIDPVRLDMVWRPPSCLHWVSGATPAGASPSDGITNIGTHLLTPETERSTHDFLCSSRDFAVGDPQADAFWAAWQEHALKNEDKVVVEEVQHNMPGADLLAQRPALFKTDSALVRARRSVDALRRKEAADAL